MQTISTTTCRRVIYREVQVISPEKPFEGTAGFLGPLFVPGDTVCLETGRNHRLRFNGLLVEAGAFATLWIKPVGANGNEMLSICIRFL
jgi:hypothetical protein